MNKVLFSALAASSFLVPLPSFAGELGVSHTLSNSTRAGVGVLTVDSVKNIQIDEKSISFTGQLSGSEFDFGEGSFSGSGFKSMTDGPDKDKGKGNDKEGGLSIGLGGVIGSGGVGQLSASLAKRTLSSTETVNTNLLENYSFSDSVFTQTSSTFSR